MPNKKLAPSLIDAVCKAYNLGECKDKPELVLGGFLHTTWKIKTTTGSFIFKDINPSMMRLRECARRFQATENICLKLKKHIPAINALKIQKNPLFVVEHKTIMVFPYIEGKILQQQEVSVYHVKLIANILANIHNTNLKIEDAPPVEILASFLRGTHDGTQENLMIIVEEKTIELATKCPEIAFKFNDCMPMITNVYDGYQQIIKILKNNLTVSHRDMDPKNVLWDEQGNPYIIDWESAGLINKPKDVLATAIYWSLNADYSVNYEYLLEFLQSYQEIAEGTIIKEEVSAGFYGLLADWLSWLDFNLMRMLDNPIESEEFLLGKLEANKTLTALPILIAQLPQIVKIFYLATC